MQFHIFKSLQQKFQEFPQCLPYTPIISYKQQSDLATRLRFLALLVSVA